jgi:hypothetical protein
MKYAELGSISHGTLRTEDLLSSFADALEYLADTNAQAIGNDEHVKYAQLIEDARNPDNTDAEPEELVEELIDALQEFAPPYSYFGAHEGDGADFGFWIQFDALDEEFTSKAGNKGDELPCACCCEHSEFLVVNERGNMALYAKQEVRGRFIPEGKERTMGDIIVRPEWVEVWGIV